MFLLRDNISTNATKAVITISNKKPMGKSIDVIVMQVKMQLKSWILDIMPDHFPKAYI